MITVSAPAKVNLALRVLARETSGFHQIETLFLALDFSDVLTLSSAGEGGFSRSERVSLTVEGPPVGPVRENLVYRAAAGFLDRAGVQDSVKIHLVKKIPPRAGLGGGSSDAGSTLRALKALFPGRLDDGEILDLADSLGSDVPFFLCSSPMALAWGRGNRVLPVEPLPSVPVLLALPPVEVATNEAYALLAEQRLAVGPGSSARVLPRDLFKSWEALEAFAVNDFETVILEANPLLNRIRAAMGETSSRLSLLSGSGAALFAAYAGDDEAAEAFTSLSSQFPGTRFVLTRTLTRVPEPQLKLGG